MQPYLQRAFSAEFDKITLSFPYLLVWKFASALSVFQLANATAIIRQIYILGLMNDA